jgi:hypothetical protein
MDKKRETGKKTEQLKDLDTRKNPVGGAKKLDKV